jgi:hypothetical protein
MPTVVQAVVVAVVPLKAVEVAVVSLQQDQQQVVQLVGLVVRYRVAMVVEAAAVPRRVEVATPRSTEEVEEVEEVHPAAQEQEQEDTHSGEVEEEVVATVQQEHIV